MDQQQESNSMKQLFPQSSSPSLSPFKIKKHIFVGISLLVSFLIFSVTVVDLVGIKPHLCFEFLSSSSTKERRNNDVCDYSYGKWVRSRQRDVDGTSYGEECRFLDPGFRCLNNGRKDSGFRQWRWQPHGCNLPRIFMAEKWFEYRYVTEEELEELKQREFSGWILTYTKKRRPARHGDRGERATYHVTVPDIFTDVGRLSGKPEDRRLTEQERSHLQTYLLTNCEDVLQYERIFMAEKRFEYRYATEEELEELKQREFSGWMLTYGFCFLGKASEYSEEIPRKSKRSSEFPRNTRKFNASDFLERSRDGRIVLVGDSIGRNQWESLLCMLSQAVSNQSEIYEVNGNPISKHKGFLSMRFPEHNVTVEYHRTPFLVVVARPPENSPEDVKMTVRVDEFNWQSKRWVGSDVLVFNTGHWWNEDKTFNIGCYFQEGGKLNKTMGVMEGFKKSLKTWKSWVLEKLDHESSYVFFRSFSPVHYRNGTWNLGEHNVTVEYHRTPFLVVVARPPENSPEDVKMTVRVDEFNWQSKRWVGSDVLVFNTGHWWNEDKTFNIGCYFQEGGKLNKTMGVMEGFKKSLKTWKSWVLEKLDHESSYVFFRSFSPVHYRNGTWNLGGLCDADTNPETDMKKMEPDPIQNTYVSEVIQEMRYEHSKVKFLNITYLTEFRKDAHPSRYREPGTPEDAPQDCSHWCLPGVPDTWNEILYAQLLAMNYTTK
ncbi:hypothetical protein DY000_02003962 [Brassica cretica]|uniref:Trichome birefringence-like N-terminal domain-containing protein n=1 Tax=Brassica cretica TaxID=69181 RepID=A0ABQ7BYS8_BRACR|nr:hypothetical protein DY000_02003962 [Brassica cretica]